MPVKTRKTRTETEDATQGLLQEFTDTLLIVRELPNELADWGTAVEQDDEY
jgi:hypothetical protein